MSMPSNVFSHWRLLILPFSLFLVLFLTPVTISNFVQISPVIPTFSTDGLLQLSDSLITHLPEGWRPGPSIGDTILLLLWVLTVWRTGSAVKKRIYQWPKKKVARLSAERNAAINEILDLHKKKEDLEDQFKRMRNTITSLMMDYWLLKESCKAYEATTLASEKMNRGLKINLENQLKDLETEAEILRTSLKMTAKRLQQREGFLQQKLVQEKILRQESEARLYSERKASEQTTKKTNTDHEKRESSYKNQIEELTKILTNMETLLHSAKFENEMLKESSKAYQAMTVNSAKEILRVKTIIEEERSRHHEEINALKTQLNMVTIQAQEKETTLQKSRNC
ncbi:WEB family protein At4g27595, chloroplastic-like [Anguilla anguilla]|uniref:WEB family protein At4g27595, chloroplastic-like n=1 Tax=Anguilla anguilla TaxID=7936 RepID=UPI0015B29A9B|nr:WEB family protein At4g27595, chloroplastic-like [Anguilla anguilla]